MHVCSYVPVNLETVQEYQDHLAQFIQTYSVDYPQYKVCVDYIVDTWIKPNSTKPLAVHFVYAYNTKHFNMGQAVTSRCEGAHAALKKFIHRRDSLPKTLPKLEMYLTDLIKKINDEEIADASKVKQKIKTHDVFANVQGRVSGFAMDRMYDQYVLYQASIYKDKHKRKALPGTCSGGFRTTFGLPCCHDIRSILEHGTSKRINLAQIHAQYILPRASANVGSSQQPIYAPLVNKKDNNTKNQSIAPKKKRSHNSATRRIKSRFEQVS